jgi:hypothetical protein
MLELSLLWELVKGELVYFVNLINDLIMKFQVVFNTDIEGIEKETDFLENVLGAKLSDSDEDSSYGLEINDFEELREIQHKLNTYFKSHDHSYYDLIIDFSNPCTIYFNLETYR